MTVKVKFKRFGNLEGFVSDNKYGLTNLLKRDYSFKIDSWNQFSQKTLMGNIDIKELDDFKKFLTKDEVEIVNKIKNNNYTFNEFISSFEDNIDKTTFIDIVTELITNKSSFKLRSDVYQEINEKKLSKLDHSIMFYNRKFYYQIISPSLTVELNRDYRVFDKIIETIPTNVIVELTTIMFNVLADYHNKKYNTNVYWLTPDEKIVWDNAIKGEKNEWHFLPSLISDYEKRVSENYEFYYSSVFYDLMKMLRILKTRRGRGFLKKGLEANDDFFHFLMKERFFMFNKDDLLIFFDVKIPINNFYSKYNCYYLKKTLDLDYEKIHQGLLENNKDSNFRKILNNSNLYLLSLSVKNLKKDENNELLKYVNDYIYKFEKDFEERSKSLNVKNYGNIEDAKMIAINEFKHVKNFEDFYWIGKNGENLEEKLTKIDVTPLYIDEINKTEQKKIQTFIKKFYQKSQKDFVFKDSNCFIFEVNKYQVLKYYLNMFNVVYSLQSIPLKIQNRIKNFNSDDTVPLWIKSFTLFQRGENMIIFFYINDSNEKMEDIFESLAHKVVYEACTMKYNVSKDKSFTLKNFEDFQENKIMKLDVVKNKVKSHVKKF